MHVRKKTKTNKIVSQHPIQYVCLLHELKIALDIMSEVIVCQFIGSAETVDYPNGKLNQILISLQKYKYISYASKMMWKSN